MKIALIGYGKMGKAIEALALTAGHEIVAKIQRGQWDDPMQPWQHADVAIEFTHPESGAENVARLLAAGIPVVCGTTGWNDQWFGSRFRSPAPGRAAGNAAPCRTHSVRSATFFLNISSEHMERYLYANAWSGYRSKTS
jgi:hypothetical protein